MVSWFLDQVAYKTICMVEWLIQINFSTLWWRLLVLFKSPENTHSMEKQMAIPNPPGCYKYNDFCSSYTSLQEQYHMMDRPCTDLLPLPFCIWNKIHLRKASHIKPGFLPPKHNPFTDFHLHANNVSWYVQGVICCLWQYKFVKIRDGNLGLRAPSKTHLKHIPCCINAATIIRYGQTWPHNRWGAGGMVIIWSCQYLYCGS